MSKSSVEENHKPENVSFRSSGACSSGHPLERVVRPVCMRMGSLLDHAILAKRTSEQANFFALEDAGNITYVTYVFRHWILEKKKGHEPTQPL